jgi:DNA-directed RNA polymerase subunit L
MELELLRKEGTTMELRVIGEDHTFCNPIRKNLHGDKRVTTAAYSIEHPVLSHPKFYVKTKSGRSPDRALRRAAKKLESDCIEVRQKLNKALKK